MSGEDAAKGTGFGLGLTWRPYQAAEVKYDQYHEQQVAHQQTERKVYKNRPTLRYGFKTNIVKVSPQGKFAKISVSEQNTVHQGDRFYVYPVGASASGTPVKPIASATAVKVLPDAAFLRIEEKYNPNAQITEGCETRQVFIENGDK
jgi:hypothetical protein